VRYSVQFRPAALVEFNESADWYEARQLGLGARYVDAIDATISSIVAAPTRPAIVHKQVRLLSVEGFPYQVYYRIVGEEIIEVLSVFHVRQNPEIWRSRS